MSARRLSILGSTGLIGRQALDVVERSGERLSVVGLAAGNSLEALAAQAARVRPLGLALERAADPAAARTALRAAAPGAHVWVGPGSAARLVREIESEIVLNGIVGAAGLASSLATLDRGARLALANKETLVVGGPLVRAALARGGELIPVDSEHSAALQCLGGRPPAEVEKLWITASGGALRDHPDWRRATRAEVLAHPIWSMGARITVDSALLFNKGLEIIEARWLFDLEWNQLDAVFHPQALLHALVSFRDGSWVLQAAPPDMALPIQLALSWPERWGETVRRLEPTELEGLVVRPLESSRYPAFEIALAAGREGGTAPCVMNAADEVAVAAFLEGALPLGQVPEVVRRVLDQHASEKVESLEQLERVDQWARETAQSQVVRV